MEYKIKSRIWIETNNNVLLGEGRMRLLKAIEKTGSLSKAAKTLKMSYKKAWHLIDTVNKAAKKPVIAFESINKNCWKFLDEQVLKINKL